MSGLWQMTPGGVWVPPPIGPRPIPPSPIQERRRERRLILPGYEEPCEQRAMPVGIVNHRMSLKPQAADTGLTIPTPVAHWRLEEASGTRADAVGGTPSCALSDGGAGQTTGKIGNCATFVRTSSQYLYAADNTTLSMGAGQSFTVGLWVYFETLTGVEMLVAKGLNAASTIEYQVYYYSSKIYLECGNGSVTEYYTVDFTTTEAWVAIVAGLDFTANKFFTQINNGTYVTNNIIRPNLALNGTGQFCLGRSPSNTHYLNGRLDGVTIWKEALDATARTNWYNGSGTAAGAEFDGSIWS